MEEMDSLDVLIPSMRFSIEPPVTTDISLNSSYNSRAVILGD